MPYTYCSAIYSWAEYDAIQLAQERVRCEFDGKCSRGETNHDAFSLLPKGGDHRVVLVPPDQGQLGEGRGFTEETPPPPRNMDEPAKSFVGRRLEVLQPFFFF